LCFSLWGGSLADRHPKRRIILIAQAAQMVPAFVLAGLAWTGLVNTWVIIGVAAISGTAMAFDMPARQAFTLDMTSREDLLNAISLNSSIFNGARVVGPALAGVVIGTLGRRSVFW
jgi:MFS family permease